MLNQSNVDHVNSTLDAIKLFPVFVRCDACDSGNIITNPCCCQCGMPLGQVVEDKIAKYSILKNRIHYNLDKIISASATAYTTYDENQVSGSSSYNFVTQPPYPHKQIDTTPIYKKCPNCWTLNNVRENKFCVCGMSTSVEEIEYE